MGKVTELLKMTNEATSAKEIASVLTALNSTGSFGGKYPIGNKELTAKVKSMEASGYIEYDDKYDKWKKGSKKPAAPAPKQEKYESTVDDLVRDTKNSIKQLVDMVNTYSVQLKLGKKVRLEDFMENIEKLEKKIKEK